MTTSPLDLESFKLQPRLVVVEAGAGSGKTFNLVRIVKKMSTEGTDISKILLVTFTNAAALEMRQRMRELLEKEGSPKALQELAAMQITTIHSFCHRAYAEYGTAAGFPAIEGAPEDSQALAQEIGLDFWRKKTREGSAPEVEPSEVVKAAELLLAETDAPAAETTGIRLSKRLDDSGLRAFVRMRVDALRAAGGLLTFDTVIQNLLDALRDESRGAILRRQIRHDFVACLIDESQDTDAKQWEVFEKIFANRPEDTDPKLLIMVGDRKQSIYGFRGANVDNYKQVVEKADERLGLNENNRSSKELIALFNRLFSKQEDGLAFFGEEPFDTIKVPSRPKDDPRPDVKAELRNHPEGPLRILDHNSTDDVVNEVARLLSELQTPGTSQEQLSKNGVAYRTEMLAEANVGVLTRTGALARTLHLALVNKGIPAALATDSSVFTSPLAPRIHHLLQCVLTPEDTSLRRALFIMQPRLFAQSGDLQAFIEANDAAMAAWLRDIRERWLDDGFGRAWEKMLSTHPQFPDAHNEPIRSELAKGPMGLRQVADLSHIGEVLSIRAREHKFTPDALLDHLAERITSANGRDDEADELEQIRPETAHPQVIVRTIHSAKGLEFQGVILPDFGKAIPVSHQRGGLLRDGQRIALVSNSSEDHEVASYAEQTHKDEANLLYVALTRAQRKISIHWKKPKENSAGGFVSGFPVVLERAGFGNSAQSFAESLQLEVSPPAQSDAVKKLLASDILRKPDFIKAQIISPPKFAFARGSTSFTELSKGPKGADADDVATHGANPLKSSAKPTVADLQTLPFLAFKGGKGPGVVMHSIMEQVDFKRASLTTHDEQTRHTVENILRGSGICLKDDKAATEEAVKETTELYLQMLPSWMTRPLSGEGEIRLADIDRADRSAEIRFSLACDLNPKMAEEIAALLADDATPGSLLAINRIAPSEEAVRGLLTGSIDLAFRHSGKFYLVDWKSNVLGPKPAHYARNVMEAEILAHKYHLQYTLYAAIFHRHMQALNPDWDYERDFGGCHYLFMRAFGHDDQGTGDFFHRPGFVTIQRLLKALGQKDA